MGAVDVYTAFCSFAEMHIPASAARTHYRVLVCHRIARSRIGPSLLRSGRTTMTQEMRHQIALYTAESEFFLWRDRAQPSRSRVHRSEAGLRSVRRLTW